MISTGVDFLNRLLEGGYEKDVITTIYGPPGSGKTNFCLLAMAALPEGKILYVDTEGSFSLARFKQVCPHFHEVLERTIFVTPTTFTEQKDAFDFLKKAVDEKVSLIIIDSIAALYRLELGISGDVQTVNRELGVHMAVLTEMARKRKIPVIITNQVYQDFEDRDKIKTVGGETVKYWSRAMLEIQKVRGGDLRKIIITKHRSIKEGNFAVFRIVQNGVEEVTG